VTKQDSSRSIHFNGSSDQLDEKSFVARLTPFIQENEAFFSCSHASHEFNYGSGRVDIFARSSKGELIAFEAKVTKWRDALHQAYRNCSFAHYSYVILPMKLARVAMRNSREFEIRGVGLCAVDDGPIRIEIPAERNEPLLPWLTHAAIRTLVDNGTVGSTAT
jgi:hypothetical protein